jgi:hypothetical protein
MHARFRQELSVWADFNALDADHRIATSLRFADAAIRPAPGEQIRLYDDEGNAVQGVVEEVRDLAIFVRPVMETWTSTVMNVDSPFSHAAPFRAASEDPRTATK